jgi:hypothetical protein
VEGSATWDDFEISGIEVIRKVASQDHRRNQLLFTTVLPIRNICHLKEKKSGNVRDRNFLTLAAKATPRQLVRQKFENLAVKRRKDRMHWRIEQDGERVIKTLEDSGSKKICKVFLYHVVLSRERTSERPGLVPGIREKATLRSATAGKRKLGLPI